MINNPFQTSYNFTKKDPESNHDNLDENQMDQMQNLKEIKAHNKSRNLVIGIQPDSPLEACKNSYWGGGYSLYSGPSWLGYGAAVDTVIGGCPAQYTYEIGLLKGCASLEIDLPGFS